MRAGQLDQPVDAEPFGEAGCQGHSLCGMAMSSVAFYVGARELAVGEQLVEVLQRLLKPYVEGTR
jgi:hypothetical protein